MKLPHNWETERTLLGGLLIDMPQLADVMEKVKAEDFHKPAHQHLFALFIEMSEQGRGGDLVAVIDEVGRRPDAERFGGVAYIGALPNACPSVENLNVYAIRVREHAVRRRLVMAARAMVEDVNEGEKDLIRLLDDAEKSIFDISQLSGNRDWHPLSTLVDEQILEIQRRQQLMQEMRASGQTIMLTGIPTGFADLDRMLAGLQKSDLLILAARPAMGKCLSAAAEVLLSDGRVQRIGEVVRRGEGEVLSLGEDGRLSAARIGAVVDDGMKPVFRVTTRLGRQVETTLSHPFLTVSGWRQLAEICVGEHIAVPRRLPVAGTTPVRECELRLLGLLIGDGGLTQTCPAFTSASARMRDDFTDALSAFGGIVWREESHGGRTPTIKVRAAEMGSEAAALGDEERLQRGNPLTQWLREIGLWGCGAAEKFIPDLIFTAPPEQIALFLSRLFATDGWATVLKTGQAQIGYGTVSERLARQIQHLLLRFGVVGCLHRRTVLYRAERRVCWQISVTDAASLRAFIREVGIFGKEEAVERVAAALAARTGRGHTNMDVVPGGVWALLDAARGAESWASVARRAGIAPGNLHIGKNLSRERLGRLAAALGQAEAARLADSDLWWDEVVAVEPLGLQQVYDLTVPVRHNFVANDVLVHNTAFALNIALAAAEKGKVGVGVFSLEMGRHQLVNRLLCAHAMVDSSKVRIGALDNEQDWPKLSAAAADLHALPMYIDDTPGLTIAQLRSKSRRLKAECPSLGLIVVDYLQLMQGGGGAKESREQAISTISRGMKILAKELQIPVVALSQLNRSLESRTDKRPMMSDLRESGAIEQDADIIMFIYRDEVYNDDSADKGIAEIIIAKQRSGPIGTVRLAFLGQFTLFRDYADPTRLPDGYA